MPHDALNPGDPSEVAHAPAADRAWRRLLIIYLVPVTIITHWPKLGFAGAGTIDKVVHFVGFGMIAWIAIHARPFGHASLGFLFGVAWVYIDEVTQAIPILGRTFSGYDMIAGWIGVAMAGAIAWLRAARLDLAAARLLDQAMYGPRRRWLEAGAVTVASIAIVGGALFARDAVRAGGYSIPAAIHPLVFSGLLGVMVATLFVEMSARARLGAALSAASRTPSVARSSRASIALAIVSVSAGAFAANVAYDGILWLLFGATPVKEHAIDHEGFLVLRSTFVLAAAALALELFRSVRGRG